MIVNSYLVDPSAAQHHIAIIQHHGLPGCHSALRLIEADGQLIGAAHGRLGRLGRMVVADPGRAADGAARAEKMVRETMNAVKDVVGFVRS